MFAVYLRGCMTTCFWSCMQVVDRMGHLDIHVRKVTKGCLGFKFRYAMSVMDKIISVFGKWKNTHGYANKCMFGTYPNNWWKW